MFYKLHNVLSFEIQNSKCYRDVFRSLLNIYDGTFGDMMENKTYWISAIIVKTQNIWSLIGRNSGHIFDIIFLIATVQMEREMHESYAGIVKDLNSPLKEPKIYMCKFIQYFNQ